MRSERESFVDQIRRAVNNCNISRYALGKRIGMDKAVMSRFMSGKGFLSEDSLNRLTAALDLSVELGPNGPIASTPRKPVNRGNDRK